MSEARVEIYDDSIHIIDHDGKEIVMWTMQEFEDDGNAAMAAITAVQLFYTEGVKAVKNAII